MAEISRPLHREFPTVKHCEPLLSPCSQAGDRLRSTFGSSAHISGHLPLCRCKKWTAPKEIITPASTGWQSELYSWSECVRITSEDLLVSLVDHSCQLYIPIELLSNAIEVITFLDRILLNCGVGSRLRIGMSWYQEVRSWPVLATWHIRS